MRSLEASAQIRKESTKKTFLKHTHFSRETTTDSDICIYSVLCVLLGRNVYISSILSDSFCFHSFNGIIMNFNRSSLVLSLVHHPSKKKSTSKYKRIGTSIETTTYARYQLFLRIFPNQIFFQSTSFCLHSICIRSFKSIANLFPDALNSPYR